MSERKAEPSQATFASRFGGLWPDRSDAGDVLRQKLESGLLTEEDAPRFHDWMHRGLAVIEGAISSDLIDAYQNALDAFRDQPDPRLLICSGRTLETTPMSRELITPENSVRLLDHFVFSQIARDILFAPAIERFLGALFEEPPLLFQSLGFEYGSQQGIHQDTAYVVVDKPMTIVGVWIALEDVIEGAGELEYYEGSHRLPEYLFSGQYKHWHGPRDGQAAHDEWSRHLHDNARAMNLPRVRHLARKGSVLFWHADLAHGGTPIRRPGTTRRSLVGHYCPASVNPIWYPYVPAGHRAKVREGPAFFTSYYYPVLEQDHLKHHERRLVSIPAP